MFLSTFVEKVRSLASNVVKPNGRRRRQAARVIAAEYFAGMVEQFEVRLLLSAPNLGSELSSNDLSTVFATVNGRWGEARVFDGVLYVPGGTPESPVVATLNLQTGETSTLVMEGGVGTFGNVSGVFQKNGEIFFTGFVEDVDRSYDVAIWNRTGHITLVPDATTSILSEDISSTGRMAVSVNNDKIGFMDASDGILHLLPGISGFNMIVQSISDDGNLIGASGFDANFNQIGVVYKLDSTTGEYRLSDVDFNGPNREQMYTMKIFDSVNGPLSASYFVNQNTFEDQTAIFSMDGTRHAELPGLPWGYIPVGDKFVVATQGLDGYLTVFNSLYEKKTYTATELFGASGYEFQAGCLAVTADDKLVVNATRRSDGKVVVKTFEVPQDVVTIAQVDANSIVIPQLVVGQSGKITWGAVAGATGYELTFIRNGVVAQTASVTSASYTVPANFAAGSCILSIRAVGKAGTTPGKWSTDKAMVVKPQAVVASSIAGVQSVADSTEKTLSWKAAPGAVNYKVTIALATSLARTTPVVFSVETNKTWVNVPALDSNVYTLTIEAMTSDGVASTPVVKTATVQLMAVDKTSVTLSQKLAGVANTLNFKAVPKATSYNVWVYDLEKKVFVSKLTTPTNSVTLPNGLEAGKFRVWVRGVANEVAGVWSTAADFSITAPKKEITDILAAFKGLGNGDNLVVTVKDFQGKVLHTYKGLSATILGLSNLPPGRYTVSGKNAGKEISKSLEFFHPVVTPSVSVTATQGLKVSWTGVAGATTEVWVSRKGETTALHKGTSSSSSYIVPKLAPGLYTVWVRVVRADGSRHAWGSGVSVDVGGQPTVKVAGSVISWTYITAPATGYKLMFVNEVTGKALNAIMVKGNSVNFSTLKSLPKGNWVVRIYAVNGDKSVSRWSEPLTILKK